MATLTHKCPHCLTEHIALRIVFALPISNIETFVNLSCPKCFHPSGAKVRWMNTGFDVSNFVGATGDIGHFWKATEFWPEPPGPTIPDHLPEDVGRIYLQGERNYPVAGNEEAAGTMYRKALDIALKKAAPEVTGNNLAARIDKLVGLHILTPSLGEWAHQIRLLGNDTAHEPDQPTREELAALRDFSDLVLRYLFTLPAMVLARKSPQPPGA